jgi:hypothetical protein
MRPNWASVRAAAGAHLVGPRHIAWQREHTVVGIDPFVVCARQRVAVDVDDGHTPAARMKPLCDRQPDAARGAGDEGNTWNSGHDLRDEHRHANRCAASGAANGARRIQFDCLIKRPEACCTGRAFIGYSREKTAICSSDTVTGCCITIHNTPSLHGGVVSEPM